MQTPAQTLARAKPMGSHRRPKICSQQPLVPDGIPKLHCIRISFHSQATSLTMAPHGLGETLAVHKSSGLPFRKLSCGAAINMPIHKSSLVYLPPITCWQMTGMTALSLSLSLLLECLFCIQSLYLHMSGPILHTSIRASL